MLSTLLVVLLAFQGAAEPKPANIRGTIIHAGSKTPIRKAKVNLTPVGGDSPSTVDSGDDGAFELKDVKPGRYRLNVTKAGYEPTAYGARALGDPGQVIRVDQGAALTRIDVALPKHAVISGKVVDTDGEPVSKALVMAMTTMYYQNGRKTRIPRGTLPVMSNDLGEFRIGELPPGKYIVCAVPVNFYQPSTDTKPSKPATEEVSVTTCFPNVRDMNEGSQIEIKDGAEIPGTDIRMLKAASVTVQGHLTGLPAGSGMITILNLNEKGFGPMGNAMHPRSLVQSADGRFEFKNVPAGSYILHTMPTGLGNTPYVVKATLDVGNQPITDLQVSAVVPFEIKGTITAEPGSEVKIGSMRIVLTPADEIISALAMATPNAEGELTVANVIPGRHRVAIAGLPPTHYVKEIRVGDKIADGDELDISDSSAKLAFLFGFAKGEVNGSVQDDKGEPVPGAVIGLIPTPRKAFRVRSVRADQNGTFKLGNVPPGDYEVVALDRIENGAWEDDEYLKPVHSKMTKVKVEDGAQSLQLKLQTIAQ